MVVLVIGRDIVVVIDRDPRYISIQQYINTFFMYHDMILGILYRDTLANVLTHINHRKLLALFSHMILLWIKHFVNVHMVLLKKSKVLRNLKTFHYIC